MDRYSQLHVDAGDVGTRQEQHTNYHGFARIDITHLRPSTYQQAQFLQLKNVQRLKRVFSTEGCHRLDPAHRVVALISDEELQASIRVSRTSQWGLLHGSKDEQPPRLIFPGNTVLRVLHGRHRLAAAQEYLSRDDAWWTVDIYLDSKNPWSFNR